MFQDMFDKVKEAAKVLREEKLQLDDVKARIRVIAMNDAKQLRCHGGQVRFVELVDVMQNFIEGLYNPLNHPVADTSIYSRLLGVSKGKEVGQNLEGLLQAYSTSFNYADFARNYAKILGSAKAAIILEKGENLVDIAELFKAYYVAFAQVREIYCTCE